jgi:hypothetical protein
MHDHLVADRRADDGAALPPQGTDDRLEPGLVDHHHAYPSAVRGARHRDLTGL